MDTTNDKKTEPLRSTLTMLFEANQIGQLKDHIRQALDNGSLNYQELVDLAKTGTEAATLVHELIYLNQIDDTQLADCIAREIVQDIELQTNEHFEKYEKFTLNVPQMSSDIGKSRSKFFNLISLLKDVSILARKLLEISPRFDSSKPNSPQTPHMDSADEKSLLDHQNRDTKSQMSEDGATSEDLLAALIESLSSDDFLVLSSSIESITIKDMLKTALILIVTHECFTLSHDIQGVALVLRRTKFMIKNILAPRNQMELIIKLLTSIGRFNEMNYVFDLFRDRNQFEILLSKGVEKTPELRIALFNYVKKNPEFFALVTLNFSMFREIAESLEASAVKRLDRLIQSKKDKKKICNAAGVRQQQERRDDDNDGRKHSIISLMTKSSSVETNLSNMAGLGGIASSSAGCDYTPNNYVVNNHEVSKCSSNKPLYSKDSLDICLVEMVDASECFAKAGCYKRSSNCGNMAKLIALQLALLPTEINVLGLQPSELNDTIVSFESFSEAYIVAQAYSYHLSWRQALFRNVVMRGDSLYLKDYCSACKLSTTLVMELVLLFKQHISNSNNQMSHDETTKLASSMKAIIACRNDVELQCKLYNQLNLIDSRDELLQNPSIEAHLKDLRLA